MANRPELSDTSESEFMMHVLKMYWSNRMGLSVGFVFFTTSMLFGSWIVRLPEIKNQLHLGEAQLGLILLGLPTGAFLGTLFTSRQLPGRELSRFTFLAALCTCAAMLFPALASTPFLLSLALFGVGFSNGMTNVSMNAAAAQVERTQGIVIMSACHGMYSLGGMMGATSAGLVARAGIPLFLHLGLLAVILALGNFLFRRQLFLVPTPERLSRRGFQLPPQSLWGLAAIGFCIMLGEGAIADWSAIFLSEVRRSNALTAALGYAAFSCFMALGRFAGDVLTLRVGYRKLVIGGSLLGAIGLLIVTGVPGVFSAIAGFALTGLGFSVVVPLLFSRAAQLQPDRPGDGIAGVSGAGIIGFMISPPTIGFIAEGFGLQNALLITALLALLATGIALRLKW